MKRLMSFLIFGLVLSFGAIYSWPNLVQALIDPALPPGPAWASPVAVSVRSLGTTAPTNEGRLSFEDNLDCLKQTYRLNGTDRSQMGCYVATAFGSLDVGNDLIGFNGNDQTVVPLVPFGPHDILLPWPGTSAMLDVTPLATDGSYLSLYRNILGATSDQHNLLGQVTAKQVTTPADFPLLDVNNRKLVANFNSLGFSEGGSWLVVESLSGSFQRINLASLAAKPFAPSFTNFGGSGFNESQVAVSPDGDYVAIANTAAKSIRVYDLANCQGPINENSICPSHEYWPSLVAKDAKFQHPVHLRFLNDGVLSLLDISNSGTTTYELSPTAGPFALLDYLALGDSYSSGEGAFSYRLGTDTNNNSCHSSLKAYPLLLASDLFTKTGANNVACSGARIYDLLSNPSYSGQAEDGVAYSYRSKNQIQQYLNSYTPGYLPQTNFASHYLPAAITVSVGGNDIGFGDLVSLCVAPHFNLHVTQANDCFDTYEDRLELAHTIDAQVTPLTTAFKKLQAASPGSTIYVVGYPLIAVDNGSCALNVHLNTRELAMIIEVTKQLNNALARAASTSGVSYVNIESALAGHRLCETKSHQVAVNGITAGSDGGVKFGLGPFSAALNFIGQESFHPNAFGHQLIEQEIQRQTHNLQLRIPIVSIKPAASDPTSSLLKQPKSGRTIKKKVPATVTKTKSVKKTGSVSVKVPGKQHGLKPRSSNNVTIIHSGVTTGIGTIVSDGDGNVDGTVQIPSSIPPGTHQIGVDGTDQLGYPITIIDVITIVGSDTDYDEDGIPNASDSCPTVPNSGHDEDSDGVDDACDNLIGLPPVPVVNGGTGGSANNPTLPSVTAPTVTIAPPLSYPSPALITPKNTFETSRVATTTQLQAAAGTTTNITTNNSVPVTLPSRQPAVLGITTSGSKQTQLITTRAGQASSQRIYTPLKYFNWQWLVGLYIFCLLLLVATKKAQLKLSSLWRRKRDSNPRYP